MVTRLLSLSLQDGSMRDSICIVLDVTGPRNKVGKPRRMRTDLVNRTRLSAA